MSFTQALNNTYKFSEKTESDKQVEVTNSSGRAYLAMEIVKEGRYVGEVREYGGIANGAAGRINLEYERVIRTAQIETTDTFVDGQTVYFAPGGSSAAGKLRATAVAGSVPYGVCEGFGGTGGAHTYVEVRPFDQMGESMSGSAVLVEKIIVPLGSNTTPVVNTNIPVGAEIMDVEVRCTTANAAGTATVSDGTNPITDAIIMAVLDVMTKAGTIDTTFATLTSAGLTVTANADGDEGIVYVYYKL